MSHSASGLWASQPLPPDRVLHWQFGPLTVWMDYRNDELRVATSREDRGDHDCFARLEQNLPESGAAAERFAFKSSRPSARAVPTLPNRSIVVRPESMLTVLPGEQAVFFVSIPASIRFEGTDSEPVPLTSIPTVVLSNTWFGDNASGELCYAVKSRARRRLEDLEKRSWRIICPITVRNENKTALPIARLCVQVRHLGVFQGQDHLWTHPVDILNHESGESLRLSYGTTPPAREPILGLLSQPAEPARESFLQRGLSGLRSVGL